MHSPSTDWNAFLLFNPEHILLHQKAWDISTNSHAHECPPQKKKVDHIVAWAACMTWYPPCIGFVLYKALVEGVRIQIKQNLVEFKSVLLFLCWICSIWSFLNCRIFFCNMQWVYHFIGWLVFGHCHNEKLQSAWHHTPCKFPHNVVGWVVISGCKFDWSQQNQNLWGEICCGMRYNVLRTLQLLAEWGNMLFWTNPNFPTVCTWNECFWEVGI